MSVQRGDTVLPEYSCKVCVRHQVTPNGKFSGQIAVDTPKPFSLRQESRMLQTPAASKAG